MAEASKHGFYASILCANILLTACYQSNSSYRDNHVALFVFGDSLFDAGNNNYLKHPIGLANFYPYGETFFKHPTGRFTNGRIIPDFIAEKIKMPFVVPYLQPGNRDFTNGVNFASGGAGALIQTYQGRVVELPTQLIYFKNVEKQLKQKLGNAGTKTFLSKTIYFFSIGGNDYLVPFVSNSSMLQFYSKKEYVSMVIGNLTSVIREVYQSGGRKFVTVTVPPLGSLPYTRSLNQDKWLSELNWLSKLHNKALPRVLKELQTELPGFKYITFDFYTLLRDKISNPLKYGFKNSEVACCGSGLYKGVLNCGKNGYELCKNEIIYLFFDGAHVNERAYKQLAEAIWSGSSEVVWPYNLKTLVEA